MKDDFCPSKKNKKERNESLNLSNGFPARTPSIHISSIVRIEEFVWRQSVDLENIKHAKI
jgi:hypothetical protein